MNIEEREKVKRETLRAWLNLFEAINQTAHDSSINKQTMYIYIKEWIDSVKKSLEKEVGV